MAVAIGSKAVGSIVKIKVDGTPREFIIVHQGLPSSMYDSSCNGTWVLMKDIYENREWNTGSHDYKNYGNSSINSYLNGPFLNLIDANIRGQIMQVQIPYVISANQTSGSTVASGYNGLSCKVFLLGGYEIGYTDSNIAYQAPLPVDGAKLSYFKEGNGTSEKIANLNGFAGGWWLRSTYSTDLRIAWLVLPSGMANSQLIANKWGIRPAFILPKTLYVSDDGSVTTNAPPTTPGSLTVPESVQGGKNATVSWGASTDTDGNLSGYILERSASGGAWSQIYQGGALSTTDLVPFGSTTVQYRVKAYDSMGAQSGYRTGSVVSVVNNVSPGAPAGIVVPELVQGGGQLAVTWGAATDSDGNLTGYSLERQTDGGEWTEIYSGEHLSFTDSVPKGQWQTVAYRVRAQDDWGANSDYTTSETRTVNNNAAPEIACALSGDLGEKSQDFSFPYSVSDEEGDPVTVTESIDGAQLRTYTPEAEAENTFTVGGEDFLKLANGSHSLKITATDGAGVSTYELTFAKLVTSASVTLTESMEADAKISVCVLSVNGEFPEDGNLQVEVTNNGKDEAPVWEDCTAQVKAGMNHVFENETAANGFAFNFRIHASRGESGTGGHIISVQGGFQ